MTIIELYMHVAKSYKNYEQCPFDGELWQHVFAGYDVQTVKNAAMFWKSSSAQSQFMPTPQQLLEIINPSKKELGANEAWAIALKAENEGATVVWTKRTAKAFLSAALPLLIEGDRTAARMAFRDAYDGLNGGNDYTVSIGKDSTERAHVIEAAIIDNKLTVHQAIGIGLDLTDDALRHAAKSGQLTWAQAGQLRIDNNFNVLAIESRGGDTPEKEAAVNAIASFINKKQYV